MTKDHEEGQAQSITHVAVLTLRVLNRRDRPCSLITTMSSPNQVADKVLQGLAIASDS